MYEWERHMERTKELDIGPVSDSFGPFINIQTIEVFRSHIENAIEEEDNDEFDYYLRCFDPYPEKPIQYRCGSDGWIEVVVDAEYITCLLFKQVLQEVGIDANVIVT